MNQVPETLKTGLSDATPDVQLDATKKRLLATVMVMTQKAGAMAFQYALHNGRSEESHHDVCMALKHQARTFLQTVDHPEVVEDILEMETLMYGSEEEESSDEDDEDDKAFRQEFSASVLKTQKVDATTGPCLCDECIEMRHAVDTWDDWAPEDEAEMYLKQRVTSAVLLVPS